MQSELIDVTKIIYSASTQNPPGALSFAFNLFNRLLRNSPNDSCIELVNFFASARLTTIAAPTVFNLCPGIVVFRSDFALHDQTNTPSSAGALFPLNQYCPNIQTPIAVNVYNGSTTIIATTVTISPGVALADIQSLEMTMCATIRYVDLSRHRKELKNAIRSNRK